MKKVFIAMAVLLLLCGCENGVEVPAEISETSQSVTTTATAAEVTATSETTVKNIETTTVTTTETTAVTTAEITAATEMSAEKEEPILTDEAREVYDILMSDTDIIFADSVDGISLIDLDFDCKPELLVSKYWRDDGMDLYHNNDVDIYGIDVENGCLNYIDTIYTRKGENVLGLKITDKLEEKWFLMSRKTIGSEERYDSSDYLVTLNGGKLHYEEIFGYRFTGAFKPESDMALIDPYFMDEKIDPENGKWSRWTVHNISRWGLTENMFNQYCSDINTVYGLCSNWLADGESMEPLKIDADTARIEIAEMTANYFLNYRLGSEPIDYDYSLLSWSGLGR